jgi:hypothetical protein
VINDGPEIAPLAYEDADDQEDDDLDNEEETFDNPEEDGNVNNSPNEEEHPLDEVDGTDSNEVNADKKRDQRTGKDNEDENQIVSEKTRKSEAKGTSHFVLAGDKHGNIVAYDPVMNTDVIPLLSTGNEIQAIASDSSFLFVSSFDDQTGKSYIDQYPYFLNTTLKSSPDFRVNSAEMKTIYEGFNITSMTVDEENFNLFAADRDDHKIVKFNYDPDMLEDFNLTLPTYEPLYFKLDQLDSVGFFNHSLYWTSGNENKTLVTGNTDGWLNSTQTVSDVGGKGQKLQIDQDNAYFFDIEGNL